MKARFIIILTVVLLFFAFSVVSLNAEFRDDFANKTMRIDYFHTADKTTAVIAIDKIYMQNAGKGVWAGNPSSLIDTFNNGQYYYKVFDLEKGHLLYSKGFMSICGEYITTDDAAKGIKRTFHETALIPFPKRKIKFVLEKRDKTNQLKPIFSRVIDPNDIEILREPLSNDVTVIEVLKNGPPQKKVDLVIVGEGYTGDEIEKFKEDLEKVNQCFDQQEPYKSLKNKFNIYGVLKPSTESGVDEPNHGIYKKTSVNASFNALGLYRYLLTFDNRSLRDIAAHVPYDSIIIMVNSQRYGGGGIYNTFCVFTVNEMFIDYLLFHEFGHSFAGLADEYYSSAVTYNDFYPKGTEPPEPNITALLDPQNLKWKHLLTKGIKIPTPWDKDKFDQMELNQQNAHLHKKEYQGKIGAFEGAGYSSEGLYRSMITCIMFSRFDMNYCQVCENAVGRMIEYYSK